MMISILSATILATNDANAQIPSNIISSTGNTLSSVTSTVSNTINNTVNQTVGSVATSTVNTNITTTSGSVSIGNPLGLPIPNLTFLVNASSVVQGVTAYGNGTINTSVDGVQMSFWFDPQGPNDGNANTSSRSIVHLTVNAEDLSGNQIPGMFIELQNQNGNDLASGDTPITFSTTAGQHYIIYANSYKNVVFNHWDDGTTNPARSIIPSQSTTLTAFYSTGMTAGVPQPPTGLIANANSSSQINLQWNVPSNNGSSAITGYKVERSNDGGTTWSTTIANTGATTRYTDSNLQPNTAYTYRVSAINSSGTSQPSNMAFAQTPAANQTIGIAQSGLIAADSLTNETRSQQQLQSNPGYWFYGGDAPNEKAPFNFSRDTSGLHIGIQAPSDGIFAGFFATSPAHNAKLWHARITNPVRTIQNQFYENGLYVQTANGKINYVTCTTLTNTQATVWAVVNATGNTTQITGYEVLYLDQSPNQPLTKDCTIVTNGNNFLQVFLDGSKVYENQKANLQMPPPFNAYLEPQTSDGKQFLVGSFQNYYVTTNSTVQVTNLPSTARSAQLVDSTGNVLETSNVSGNTVIFDVGQFNLPIASTIKVLDSNNNVIASSAQKVYGGDTYSMTSQNVTQSKSGITLGNTQSTSGTTDSSNQITLSNFNAGTGNDRLLVVGISANNNNAASVTFGGVPLTRAESSFYHNDAELWYIKNPTGTGNLVVTTSGPTQTVVGAYVFSGVNQTSPILTHGRLHNTTPSSPSISVATQFGGDWVVDQPSIYGGSTLSNLTCDQGWNVNIPNEITGSSSSAMVPSPGTITCKWTASIADLWDDVVVELKADS